MKTNLQKLIKKLLVFGSGIAAYTAAAQAPCSLYTGINNIDQYGNVTDSAAVGSQAGWESYIYVNFGDGTNMTYNTNAPVSSYLSSHQYTANGTYIISTYLHSYDPADSMNYCNSSSFDTVVISGLACSVNVGAITYYQNGVFGSYTFNTTVSGSGGPMIYWVIMDSLNNTVYTQTGGTGMNFTFPQNGYYQVTCAAYVYDSASTVSCADTSFLWVPVNGNPSGGCNLQAGVNINPTTGLSVNIQGTTNNAYQYSYIYVDGNFYYNTPSVNYTFPTAGSYYVCFYAQDTTAATYCYDSLCVLYNTGGSNPVQCNASFYIFQDSLTPTVWYGINNSTGSPYTTYLWDFGDGTASTQMYPTHVYNTPGNYVICLTVVDSVNNCTSTYCDSSAAFRLTTSALMGSISIMAPTGIKETNHMVSEVKLFPNPMADVSNIAFNSTIASNGTIEVVGLLGNTVLSQAVNIAKGNNEFRMNMAGLANGVYYVKIVAGSEVLSTVKAVK